MGKRFLKIAGGSIVGAGAVALVSAAAAIASEYCHWKRILTLDRWQLRRINQRLAEEREEGVDLGKKSLRKEGLTQRSAGRPTISYFELKERSMKRIDPLLLLTSLRESLHASEDEHISLGAFLSNFVDASGEREEEVWRSVLELVGWGAIEVTEKKIPGSKGRGAGSGQVDLVIAIGRAFAIGDEGTAKALTQILSEQGSDRGFYIGSGNVQVGLTSATDSLFRELEEVIEKPIMRTILWASQKDWA